jgi:two-component system, LytTR family, response regulator
MIKAVIVEDEVHLLQMMTHFLGQNPNYEVVGAYSNPEEAINKLPHLQFDVAFIDIEMPKINGIELAQTIKSDQYQFVFTTAYPQYAIDAIKLEASDYLLKPITPEAIDEITGKLQKMKRMRQSLTTIDSPKKPFQIHCAGSFQTITPDEEIVKFPTRKVEELFAYLLVNHQTIVNKWRLAEELWPGKSMNSIYNSVYLLNKTFKEYALPIHVVNLNDGYKLSIEDESAVEIDLFTFETVSEQLSSKELLTIVNHFSLRGPIFNEKDYQWVTLYREKLTVKHETLLLSLIEHFKVSNPFIHANLQSDYAMLYECPDAID